MEEKWSEIDGSNGHYEVSNLGRVRSIKRIGNSRWYTERTFPSVVLKPQTQREGYQFVLIRVSGKSAKKYIHREVAKQFIPNPSSLPQVNHIDGNKLNNAASNLEWCTAKENCRHAIASGLYVSARGERISSAKLKEADIIKIRALASEGMMHKDIAAIFAVGRKAVTKIVNRQRWAHIP